ncbi:MAG: glycosyltransferase [Thiomargarita sp.]|nr:glycosyltransferase [Thiomargarita sp.]
MQTPTRSKTRKQRLIQIAIIVRTKNRPQQLKRCLRSLVAQKRPADSVVVINDGGSNIDSVIKRFSKLKIHLINNDTSQGRAVAGNQGVQAVKSDVIGFLDDDDRFLPGHLQRLEKAMLNFDSKVVYSGCRLLKRDVLGDKEVLQEEPIGEFNDSYDAQRLYYENYIPLINLLINRKLWLEVGGFDEKFDVFEDWDVLLRLSKLTSFYHVDYITAEYAIWGNGQITQNMSHDNWIVAYQQFLAKHLLSLDESDLSKQLAEYWRLSQERRGILTELVAEKHSLLDQLATQNQVAEYEQLQSDWTTKYQLLESEYTQLQSDWQLKYEQLQSDWQLKYEQLQTDWQLKHESVQSGWTNKYEQLQQLHRMDQLHWQQQYGELEQSNKALEESSQQSIIGINTTALKQIWQSLPATDYRLATLSDGIIDDYQHLADWIHSRATKLEQLQLVLVEQTQPINEEYQLLTKQLNQLINLITASHWPQIRRYANSVREIQSQTQKLFNQVESYFSNTKTISCKIGLDNLLASTPAEIPLSRCLSNHYPVVMTIAGSAEKPNVMQNMEQLGDTPFVLDTVEKALVFNLYCSLDNFYRLDILFGTFLRTNSCDLRIIIRDIKSKEVIRLVIINALYIFDNRLHPIEFNPIQDSAGKNYQVEIDSPDATNESSVAVWCYSQKPSINYCQQYPESTTIELLPQWVQAEILNSPLSLNSSEATHLFMLFGIQQVTSVLQLKIFLRRLNDSIIQANSSASVIIVGQFNAELRLYCQQQQLEILEIGQIPANLLTLLNQNKQQNATYSWYCEITAMPQLDCVVRAEEIFANQEKAALIIPLEKYQDGKIRAGYATFIWNGILETPMEGNAADHPYHNYRRVINAASSQLIIIKNEVLNALDLQEVGVYYTPMYQVTELIWQLQEKQYQTYYEGALCYEHTEAYPEFTIEDSQHDNQYFYQRWEQPLLQLKISLNSLNRVINPLEQPTVLVIDATLPTYDEDSGSLRLYTLLKLWVALGYRITFFPDNLDGTFKYRHALESLGIEVFHGDYRLPELMDKRRFDFAFISRVEIGQRYIPFIRLVAPKTIIFYDTVDIHYIREQRQAEIENNPKLLETAKNTKRQELANCISANRVITVTEEDGHHLQKELPNLDFAVIPNIHQQYNGEPVDFAQRKGLVFIGNYNHTPNEDSVYYFIDHILPKVRQKLPYIRLYLIGSNMSEKMQNLVHENVEVVGWVDEVEPEFAKRRVFVSFLRYGAGMKGKLGQALSVGLPVVTTSIGAEGMGLQQEETALIADDPTEFAEAICRLYSEEHLWNKLSSQGKQYIEEHYGEDEISDKLRNLLNIKQ